MLGISKKAEGIAPSLTLAISDEAKAMKARGIDVIGFGVGEPDFDTPAPILDAAREALAKGMTRYTPAAGTAELRRAICAKLLREDGLSYEPGQIVVSNGAKHSLFNIFQAILNPGDEVILPAPCWLSYPEMVRMADGVPVFVDAGEESGFLPTISQLRSAVTPRTKALLLNNPGNPSGAVWPESLLREIAELAVEKEFYVISDEIYQSLVYGDVKPVSIASLNEKIKAQTFVVNGVSKAYAMTGWRIGYCAGPATEMKAIASYQSQATSNPNSIAQYAAAAALNGPQDSVETMRRAFEERRDELLRLVDAIPGISCVKPDGAFYVLLNIRSLIGKICDGQVIEDSMAFSRLLLQKAHVAVVPGAAFRAEGYVRISYATGLDSIREGLRRIAEFVAGLDKQSVSLADAAS